jgi:molybdenum cofactor biosynthesis enzyme MoaA
MIKEQENNLFYDIDSDLFNKIPTASSHSPQKTFSAPYTTCIELSQRCNMKCKICISSSSPSMADDTFWVSAALENLTTAFGSLRIVWSGGEPTIHNSIREWINKSSQLGNVNVLVTNATRFIADLPTDWVDISIYGGDAAYFRDYTQSDNFLKHQRNIKLYANSYPRVSASFVLGVHGEKELRKMVEFAVDSGISRLKFHRLSLAGRIESTPLDSIARDMEVVSVSDLCSKLNVVASFSRAASSDAKRAAYWVAKWPGVLTTSAATIPISERNRVIEGVLETRKGNRSLYSE